MDLDKNIGAQRIREDNRFQGEGAVARMILEHEPRFNAHSSAPTYCSVIARWLEDVWSGTACPLRPPSPAMGRLSATASRSISTTATSAPERFSDSPAVAPV